MQTWTGLPAHRLGEVPDDLRSRLVECHLGTCTQCGFHIHAGDTGHRTAENCPRGCRVVACDKCKARRGEPHAQYCTVKRYVGHVGAVVWSDGVHYHLRDKYPPPSGRR